MAEYRLEDLARASGVSTRNIRAYRERGLLDAPRRVGRSALYDDYHLSQLHTISQLLGKGYTSVHIAEFFTSMRQGTDLADILGLQRAVLGTRTASSGDLHEVLELDTGSEEVARLIAHGLAEIVAGKVVMVDYSTAEILNRSADPLMYVRVLLRFVEAADDSLENFARAFVASLTELYRVRVDPNYRPKPAEVDELRQVVQDYRALGETVMSSRFDQATRRFMVTSASDCTAGILLDDEWETHKPA